MLPSFQIGRKYNRREDLHKVYGGSRQSGISPSATSPLIFIFTGDSGEQYGYRDGFDSEGVFSYSGEGQEGDMTFRAGNKALRDHAKDGRAIHLFRALGKSKPCEYVGEFVVANHEIVRGPDRKGSERDIIVFHMMRVESVPNLVTESHESADEEEPLTLSEARIRALQACMAPNGVAGMTAVRAMYKRSSDVKRYVLMRDAGHCRGCGRPAPFLGRKGLPYLEPHHTTRLSDGGLDHPRHVVCLCPNCHAQVHRGLDGETLNRRLIEWLNANEPEA